MMHQNQRKANEDLRKRTNKSLIVKNKIFWKEVNWCRKEACMKSRMYSTFKLRKLIMTKNKVSKRYNCFNYQLGMVAYEM